MYSANGNYFKFEIEQNKERPILDYLTIKHEKRLIACEYITSHFL